MTPQGHDRIELNLELACFATPPERCIQTLHKIITTWGEIPLFGLDTVERIRKDREEGGACGGSQAK